MGNGLPALPPGPSRSHLCLSPGKLLGCTQHPWGVEPSLVSTTTVAWAVSYTALPTSSQHSAQLSPRPQGASTGACTCLSALKSLFCSSADPGISTLGEGGGVPRSPILPTLPGKLRAKEYPNTMVPMVAMLSPLCSNQRTRVESIMMGRTPDLNTE